MSDLTTFNNVDAMVASYERSKQLLTDGFAAIAAARSEFDSHFALGSGTRGTLDVTAHAGSHHQIDQDATHALLQLKRQAWEVIVDRLNLRPAMSIRAWNDLQKMIQQETEKLPEITIENVTRFGRDNVSPAALERMLCDAIVEVFEWLRPGLWSCEKYKRNSQLEVPRRLVLSYVVSNGFNGRFYVDHDRTQRLIALENVVRWLDGKGQVARSHKSDLQQAIESCAVGAGHGKTDYFEFRCYRNRSLHLTWLRTDLLKEFNRIAGGERLRPTKERAADLAVA